MSTHVGVCLCVPLAAAAAAAATEAINAHKITDWTIVNWKRHITKDFISYALKQ